MRDGCWRRARNGGGNALSSPQQLSGETPRERPFRDWLRQPDAARRLTDPTRTLDGPQSWRRLALAIALSTLGCVGMWSVIVVLPQVQAEFGASRADVSLAYTATMIGFAVGGVVMGRLCDRYGTMLPVLGGTLVMAAGYVLAGFADSLVVFALLHGIAIAGLGSSAMFGPLMADISRWFVRRRGIAVSLCACGNYLAGAIWPPAMQPFLDTLGWRQTYIGIGVIVLATMLPLVLLLRAKPPSAADEAEGTQAFQTAAQLRLGLSSGTIQTLLVVAGVACCVAMAMPQVHIVAYCADLGYGAARGAEMLSLMLACGVASRILSGLLADRIGGFATLLLGSFLQMVALALYLFFDGLASLFAISALFGLFQGGIVPSYALVVRAIYPASEAGMRVGIVLMATLVGMALGGWLSGAIFDWTGSYALAFVNGVAWNILNVAIVAGLMWRARMLSRF
jgi:MFS family permease